MEKIKIVIRQFREGSSDFWVDTVHYNLNKDGEIMFCAGGIDSEDKREALKSFIKRNKKVFKKREESSLSKIEKEYNEVITFGKYINEKVQDIFYKDKKYLIWMRDSYSFSLAQKTLKEQITEILK